MMTARKRGVIAAGTAMLLMLSGCTIQTADTRESAVSSVQMAAFNQDLNPVTREDHYRTTYEIFVYSFCDSNGDGIGDLNGIRSKLDYIQGLGFDELWLTPVHPSDTYHKYDVKDYCAIDPAFGTMEDYEALLKDCHERGMRVLLDLPVNHTAFGHAWFQEAASYYRSLPAGTKPDAGVCPYADYYLFSDSQQDGYAPLAGTDWFYEARFWSEMPDLNLTNEAVRKEIKDIVSFWLSKGVDGFRLDAVTSYYTGNPESNVDFMRWFTDTCKEIKPDCYIVGEAWTDRRSIAVLYESGIDSLFDFPFADSEGVIRSVLNKAYSAKDYVQAMLSTQETFSAANPNYVDAPFYTNHDMARSAGFYPQDNGPKTKMAYAMSLLMSGNSFVYYGEEIGMKGSGKDENKRAPMYWSNDPADPDFCDGPPNMDPVEMKFPPLSEQIDDPLSIYNWFKEVIKVRKAFPVIADGTTAEAGGISDDAVAAFIRYRDGEDPVLIVMNLRDENRDADLTVLNEELNLAAVLNTDEQSITMNQGILHLPAYSIAILTEVH
ncbi:MAG: hypothetical protein IKE28_12180 [Solobacterium sp.]|nr:hypothetical protein [Solobacterium sp.]